MNKNLAIKRINGIGKAGRIISIIILIVTILGFVGTLAGTIFFGLIPKDTVTADLGTVVSVDVDMNRLGEEISDEDAQQIMDSINGADDEMTLDGNDANINAEVNGNVLTLNIDAAGRVFRNQDVVWLGVVSLIYIGCTIVFLVFLKNLCKAFEVCESPFEDGVIKSMRNFALSILPWGFVGGISHSITESVLGNQFKLSLSADLGVIIVVLVIFGLSYIFKYGAVLQQESDETL